MFGRKPATETVIAPAEPQLELVKQSAVPNNEYLRVADEIGLKNPSVTAAKLLETMRELKLPVWELGSVNRFLQAEREKIIAEQYRGVFWHPMRDKDKWPDMANWGWILTDFPGCAGIGRRVGMSSMIYPHEIPMHALRLVHSLEKRMPGELAFYVSDYQARPGNLADPFLLAAAPGPIAHGYVIDHWNEPHFGQDSIA